MALAAEPAVTGKLPGDSEGRGGELFGSQAQNHSKERPRLCPGLPGLWAPLPRLVPSLWERAAPRSPASPGLELPAVSRGRREPVPGAGPAGEPP